MDRKQPDSWTLISISIFERKLIEYQISKESNYSVWGK